MHTLEFQGTAQTEKLFHLKKKEIKNKKKKKTFMKGKMETEYVGIWQNRALKMTFLYQISSELRFTIFPNLWKNAAIFPNATSTCTSPCKVKKITGLYSWHATCHGIYFNVETTN